MPELLKYKEEIYRKYIHLSSSVIGLILLFWGRDNFLPWIVGLAILVPILDIVRQKYSNVKRYYYSLFSLVTRPTESNTLTGASWLFLGSAITILLFDQTAAVTGLLFLSLGDSMAAIIGQKFGSTKIGSKSLEGTLAFFITCVLVSPFIPGLNILIAVTASLVAALVELLDRRLNDNLTIPVFTALTIQIMEGIL